jgi:hypothetical protein
MEHIRKEGFVFTNFGFCNRGITKKGLQELGTMNLLELGSLSLLDLEMAEEDIIGMLNTIQVPKIKTLSLSSMNDMRHFLLNVNWTNFRSLDKLSVTSTGLQDCYTELSYQKDKNRRSKMINNLQELSSLSTIVLK